MDLQYFQNRVLISCVINFWLYFQNVLE
jgi:hypothetical protein